jgi:hypothetical protein
VRAVRIMLFSVLGATIVAVVALIITSNVERGPAHDFRLVPTGSATKAQLVSDAAALVRRLEGVGYSNTQSQVVGNAITLTLYGSGNKVNSAFQAAIVAGRLEVRPVECAVPPYRPVQAGERPQPARSIESGCEARYLLSASALKVDPHTGAPENEPAPDPSFVAVPDTPAASDAQSGPALYATTPGSGTRFVDERLLLGPAQVENDAVASAGASKVGSQWAVQITLTTNGARSLDALAHQQFHAYMAICVDGSVLSASIVEPTSSSFSSLGGQLEVRSDFTKTEAVALADDLTSPLSVPLKVIGSS